MPILDDIDWLNLALPLTKEQNDFIRARSAMYVAIEDFHSALEVFESAAVVCRGNITGWKLVAARDGAISIYNFERGLNACLSKAKLVSVDEQELNAIKDARSLFGKTFPYAKEVRDAVGHYAERISSLESFAKHGLIGNVYGKDGAVRAVAGTQMTAIESDVFTITHRGHLLGYKINRASYEALVAILCRISPRTTAALLKT